jgi:hypothetical protein
MNEPAVSLEALDRLAKIEEDKAMEKVMRKHGFTETDLNYIEKGGEQRLFISKKAFNYIMAHQEAMKSEIQEAINVTSIKALDAGLAIIELQKIGEKA